MSISLQWEEAGALLEIVGDITLHDYRQLLKLASLDSRYEKSCYLIVDATKQAHGKALRKWELEVLALFTAGIFKHKYFVSAAVINPLNQASMEAAQCYGKLAKNPHAIFLDMVEARNWIRDNLDKS